jgi:hypothetical protein
VIALCLVSVAETRKIAALNHLYGLGGSFNVSSLPFPRLPKPL